MKALFNVAISGLLIATFAAPVWAEDEKEEAIEYRQGVFSAIKWNFAPMAAMVKGEVEFDKDAFVMRAERVAALSKMPLEGFKEGTAMDEEGHKHENHKNHEGYESHSKPEIWKDWDDFKAKMAALEEESAKLVEVAKAGDMDQIKAQFAATGKSCKSCHDEYRHK